MLLKQQHYINGAWQGTPTLAVHNPATGEVIGHIANGGAAEAEQAIHAAAAALPAWRAQTAKARSKLLRRWYDLIIEHQDALAELLTREQGKPLAEARGEIAYGAAYIEWYAEEAKRVYGETIPAASPNQKILVQKQPVGVCAAITPWNFPNAMITRKAAPALAAGCTFVIRPASQTPFSALALAVLADAAGIPPGVFNVITGDAPTIGKVFTENDTVRKFSFTGSTETGRLLMRQCASTIKKISLELGGNAPFIVFDDADLDAAVAGAILSKFRNAGQTCVCANRFYVQSGVYDAFVAKLVAAMEKLNVGNGLDENIHIGPLIDAAARAKVQSFIDDATAHGASVLGGGTHPAGEHFMQPAVIRDASAAMRVAREEIFGPLAPVFRFDTEEAAIAAANATEYGLAAYFYARDIGRIHRVLDALEYGMIGVNSGILSNEAAPFGGVKQSGLGREGGRQGIEDYLESKYCLIQY
ncbi:MAG: NAD-dependent succinate-semialdehyde dehydrogenase [Cardiobacteriaceae bacterium]|nr:NAD-dependent succinate-semialdehyde dehydrogenase [Cardiobacteriaceae bacterium]